MSARQLNLNTTNNEQYNHLKTQHSTSHSLQVSEQPRVTTILFSSTSFTLKSTISHPWVGSICSQNDNSVVHSSQRMKTKHSGDSVKNSAQNSAGPHPIHSVSLILFHSVISIQVITKRKRQFSVFFYIAHVFSSSLRYLPSARS